ncbi:uncharacterized protein [Littorina saxatilis]|uniref:uncharacterized protein n=1 Tax=Littorina saxatilis TaxID=31220 RepID=UPI0038B5298A
MHDRNGFKSENTRSTRCTVLLHLQKLSRKTCRWPKNFPSSFSGRFEDRKCVEEESLPRQKDFVFSPYHRLCIEHFVGRRGPTKSAAIPSLFPSRNFMTSVICEADQDTFLHGSSSGLNNRRRKTQICDSDQEAFPLHGSSSGLNNGNSNPKDTTSAPQAEEVEGADTTDCPVREVDVQTPSPHFIPDASTAVSSILLHDYTGPLTSAQLPTSAAVATNVCQLDLEDRCTASISLVFEDISSNKDKVNFYTGIPNGETFKAVFDELSSDRDHLRREVGERSQLRYVDEFLLVLMRLRLGLLLGDLADRF